VYLPGPRASPEQAEPELRGSRHHIILLGALSIAFIGFAAIVAPASAGALPPGE
jgi:hypothetical protein